MTARSFARWFRMKEFRVQVAHDVGSAVHRLRTDLSGLVAALDLPDGAGFDVIEAARRLRSTLPVLAVTNELDARKINRVQLLNVALAIKPDLLANLRCFVKRCRPAMPPHEALLRELASAHGLTPAERRVVECGLESTRHAVLVRKLGVAENTAKTQIRSVLSKTGAASLDELVTPLRGRLLGSLVAQP